MPQHRRTKISTWDFLAYQEIEKLPRYGKKKNLTEFPKITILCEKHFEESCFNKSVDLGRTIMNSLYKD